MEKMQDKAREEELWEKGKEKRNITRDRLLRYC